MKPLQILGTFVIGWYSAKFVPFNTVVDFAGGIIDKTANIGVLGEAQASVFKPMPMYITPEESAPTPPVLAPDTVEVQRQKLTQAILAIKVGDGLRLDCYGRNKAACPALFMLAGEYYRIGGE